MPYDNTFNIMFALIFCHFGMNKCWFLVDADDKIPAINGHDRSLSWPNITSTNQVEKTLGHLTYTMAIIQTYLIAYYKDMHYWWVIARLYGIVYYFPQLCFILIQRTLCTYSSTNGYIELQLSNLSGFSYMLLWCVCHYDVYVTVVCMYIMYIVLSNSSCQTRLTSCLAPSGDGYCLISYM